MNRIFVKMPPVEMSNRTFAVPAEDAEVPELLPSEEDHHGIEMASPLLMPGAGTSAALMAGPPSNLMCGPTPHQPWGPSQYQQQSFPQAPHGYPYPYGYRYPPYENR